MHRDLQVFLRRLEHLSLLCPLEVQSQVILEGPCLLEYLLDLDHQGFLVLLSLAKSPVKHILIMKWIMDKSH